MRIDWPARNPDTNPIEHVWDELGRRIRHTPRHTPVPKQDWTIVIARVR